MNLLSASALLFKDYKKFFSGLVSLSWKRLSLYLLIFASIMSLSMLIRIFVVVFTSFSITVDKYVYGYVLGTFNLTSISAASMSFLTGVLYWPVVVLLIALIPYVVSLFFKLHLSYKPFVAISLLSQVPYLFSEIVRLILILLDLERLNIYQVYLFYAACLFLLLLGVSRLGGLSQRKFRLYFVTLLLLALLLTTYFVMKDVRQAATNASLLPREFSARIGDRVLFTQDDITAVCTSRSCSTIYVDECHQGDRGLWKCGYSFAVNISSHASDNVQETFSNLSIVESYGRRYLNASLRFYLDNVSLNDELELSPDLKGVRLESIQVFGTANGTTLQGAFLDAAEKMTNLQYFLRSRQK